MPVAYVTEPGATIQKSGRSLRVVKEGQVLAEWELIHLQSLVLIGPINMTTPAMTALLEAGVETAFLRSDGRLIGQLTPPKAGNVNLRMAQYRLSLDPAARLVHARAIVDAKIAAMLDVLSRYADNYPELALEEPRRRLKETRAAAAQADAIPRLMGFEGQAAAVYWGAFALLNRSGLPFDGRSARPPRDPVNTLLSFGYVMLANEIWSLLDAMGFDPYLGLYHETTTNRPSLALDLMEPLRHSLVDRMVLRCINLGQFKAADFTPAEQGGYHLSRDALRRFIGEYERAMQSVAVDGEVRCGWRELLRRRCEALGRSLTSGSGTMQACFAATDIEAEADG